MITYNFEDIVLTVSLSFLEFHPLDYIAAKTRKKLIQTYLILQRVIASDSEAISS